MSMGGGALVILPVLASSASGKPQMGTCAHKLEEPGHRHGAATSPRLRTPSEITNYGSTSRIATPI